MTNPTRADLLALLRSTRDRVSALRGLSEAEQSKSYGAGKWTVRQILAHLADSATINLCRFERAAAMTGSPVLPYDENGFAERLHYAKRPAALSVDLILAAQSVLAHYVESFTDEEMSREADHPEKGRVACTRWAEIGGLHCQHHLGQIDCALRGETWVFVDTPGSWQYRGAVKPAGD